MSQHKITTMTEAREEIMVISSNGNEITQLKRKAHFLKPTLPPSNSSLPNSPSFPPSSNPNMKLLKKLVSFKGRTIPPNNWDTWVQSLQKTHQKTWKKAGIFQAIQASTYTIKRHNELILNLAQHWCPETNTFILPWGEFTITLEDVMILGGFSVLGDFVTTPFENKENVELGIKMIKEFSEKRRKNGPIYHYEWMNFFMGKGGKVEHVAFLTLWLSRYVFSTGHYVMISQDVIPIAVSLSSGSRIALAPAVLASIYNDLSLLQEKITRFMDEWPSKKLDLWAPFQLVQVWAWERFPVLGPSPCSLRYGEPRLARWDLVKKPKDDCFLVDVESLGEIFVWRPYALLVENWQCPEFYSDQERLMVIDSKVGEEMLSYARCLQACELVGLACSEQYFPHRVGMQFGMDQDIPGSVPRFSDVSLDGMKLHLPSRMFKGDVTARYYDWFRKELCSENNDPRRVTFNLGENSMKNNTNSPAEFSLFGVSIAEVELPIPPYFDPNSIPNSVELRENVDDGSGQRVEPPSCMLLPCDATKSLSNVKEMTPQSLETAVNVADGNADSIVENVSSMECFREATESCDRSMLQFHDYNCDAILSQRVLNEVQLEDTEMEEHMEIDEYLTCTSTGSKIVQGVDELQGENHEIVGEVINDKGKEKEELETKSQEPLATDNVQAMTVEGGNMTLEGGSINDPIICEDNEDDDHFDPDEVLGYSELEARISALERELFEMQEAYFRGKLKAK